MEHGNLTSKSTDTIDNLRVCNMCSKSSKSKTHLNLSVMKNTNDHFIFMAYDEIYPKEHREKIREFVCASNEKYFYVKVPKNMSCDAFIEKLIRYTNNSYKRYNDNMFQFKNTFLIKSIQRTYF